MRKRWRLDHTVVYPLSSSGHGDVDGVAMENLSRLKQLLNCHVVMMNASNPAAQRGQLAR